MSPRPVGLGLGVAVYAQITRARSLPAARATPDLGPEALADLPPAAVMVWDRYLAYGVALGASPVASRAVELSAGRRGSIRSTFAEVPRLVAVIYPRDPFAYTQAGARLVWSTAAIAFWAGVGIVYLRSRDGWSPWLRWTLLVAGAGLVVRAVYRLVRAARAKLFPVTVTGMVLAMHAYRPRIDQNPRWHQVVVDDGEADRTRPWLVRTDWLGPATVGAVVRLRAQPWTRYGLALTVIRPRPTVPVRSPAISPQ